MLTTQELIDMPTGTPVYLVVFKPGEHNWYPISKNTVPLEKKEFTRTGRLRKNYARHAIFIFDYEANSGVGIGWDAKGWCDRDSVAMACFRDEDHFHDWEQQIDHELEELRNALLGSIESTFEDILGEKVEIRFE